MDSTGVSPPPAVMLWLQCVLVAAEVLRVLISQLLSWGSQCMGRKKRDEQPVDRQDDKAPGETLWDSRSNIASTTVLRGADTSGVDERSKSSVSSLLKLTQLSCLP